MAMSGLFHVRTELQQLLIIPSLAHHPVQTNRQPPSHSNLGDLPPSSQHEVEVPAAPCVEATHCDLCRLDQQKAQQRASLLGDVSQPAAIPAGILHWNQAEIAGHLPPTLKAFRFTDNQHERHGGEWT